MSSASAVYRCLLRFVSRRIALSFVVGVRTLFIRGRSGASSVASTAASSSSEAIKEDPQEDVSDFGPSSVDMSSIIPIPGVSSVPASGGGTVE